MTAPTTVLPSDPHNPLLGERNVLELIATGAPLETTLDLLCQVIDNDSGLRSSIFLLDGTGQQLSLAAGPRLPRSWRNAVGTFPVSDMACGTAVTSRAQVISPDIDSDPQYSGYHDAARAAGIRAVWSTPFMSKDGAPLGTFAVYSSTIGHPSTANLELVNRATHLARIAVERQRTEAALRESEVRFSRAFYGNPAPMVISSYADGRIAYVNDAFLRMFGYLRAEIVGRPASVLYFDPRQLQPLIDVLQSGTVRDVEIQGRTKAGVTLNVLLAMERIEVLGEQCVLAIAMDISDRKRAERALRANEEELREQERLLRLVLNAIPVGVIVVNPSGDIILSNPASAQIWSGTIRSGKERWAMSRAWWHDTGRPVRSDEWASRRALTKGETSINEVIDIEAFDGTRKTIQNSAVPIGDEDAAVAGAVVVNEDITARTTAEQHLAASAQQLRRLAAKLMHAQDDERRRIATLLHETTAQNLAALKMLLARLTRTSDHLSDGDRAVLQETGHLADHVMAEVRTLSYLLHPPFLDETGLLSAIRWYAEGFAERSGVAVHLDLPKTLPRQTHEVEMTLFRTVQESLINVHRHANSSTAVIRLLDQSDVLTLEIEDHGQGMTPEILKRVTGNEGTPGVGIAGMRERLRQLGGTLEIDASPDGTRVRAHVPVPATAD